MTDQGAEERPGLMERLGLRLGQRRAEIAMAKGGKIERAGEVVDRVPVLLSPGDNPAEELRQLIRRQEDQERVAARQERIRKRLGDLDVPDEYAAATLETFNVDWETKETARRAKVLRFARRYLHLWEQAGPPPRKPEVPPLVFFRGGPGTGKGHIAYSLAKAIVLLDRRVVFTELGEAIRHIRAAWTRGAGLSESKRLKPFREADLLILDEVSRHALYGHPTQHLYDLLAWRAKWRLPTIGTTNETAEGLQSLLGPALADRVAGSSGIWEFGALSYRPNQRFNWGEG